MNKTDIFHLERVPQIEGLAFRHFEGECDYPKILAIYTSLHASGQYTGDTTIEGLRAEYTNLSNSDPHNDILMVEVGGQLVAFSRVFWERQINTQKYAYGVVLRVDPTWQGRGIEEILLIWAEARGRDYASVLPEGEIGFHLAYCWETDQQRFRILTDSGYIPERYYHAMSRDLVDLPESPLPQGITVRPALPKDYRKIWDAANDAFQDEFGAAEPTEEWYQSYMADPNCQPILWQVAWDGDEVVGSVQNYISLKENEVEQRLRGYTEGISVRREWRGRGIARALICRSMAMFKLLNMEEVALAADSENPTGAMRLYTGLGYKRYRTTLAMVKPLKWNTDDNHGR